MVRSTGWSLLASAMLLLACGASTMSENATSLGRNDKRGMSVLTFDEIERWDGADVPAYVEIPALESHYRRKSAVLTPWPPRAGQGSPVRYCFLDETAKDQLHELVLYAIAIWSPAFEYSSLSIIPDPACNTFTKEGLELPNYFCVCGDQESGGETAEDVLRISDGADYALQELQEKNPGKEVDFEDLDFKGLRTSTTTGYYYAHPDAHVLLFGAIHLPDFDEQGLSAAQREAQLITIMAHELGHAVGLLHEHQRPDAAAYVEFYPQYLNEYDKAMARIQSSKNANLFPANVADNEKLAYTLAHPEIARKLFPKAADMIPEEDASFRFTWGGDFDYGSIMIYSSDRAIRSPKKQNLEDRRVPLRKKHPGNTRSSTKDEDLFWTGGDRFNGRISVGDIKRVAKLYPGTPSQVQAAKQLKEWKARTVVVPGLGREFVVAPTKEDVRGPDKSLPVPA